VGVHPSYKSLENQGYFEASLFKDQQRGTYEFYFYRSLFTFFEIQLYLLVYLVEKWPSLIREVANIVEVATDLRKMYDKTVGEFQKRARD